jgi:hypothetical protein
LALQLILSYPFYGASINPIVPVLHTEVQVAGHCALCTTTIHSLYQPTDYVGRPSSKGHVGLIKLLFTEEEALSDFWAELGLDSYRRVSGHIGFFHEEGHTLRRLTFYDAACVRYEVRFDARGLNGQPSLETKVHFSAAALNLNGAHTEAHTQLWWEKNPVNRFNALTKPPELPPSPMGPTCQPDEGIGTAQRGIGRN